MEEDQENHGPSASAKKKRCRRRRKPRSPKTNKVQPVEKQTPKKCHDAPMTKRDLYFVLNCELVSIGKGAPAVARVTMINWDAEVVLDTFVQVPVPVTDFRGTGISPEVISTHNPQAMSFAKARQAVQQTLKGKILVGYKLQDHLTSLGLTHPSTDVRDAAQFQLFQYEELDGVTHERLVIERSLNDLAMEFLQRELNHPFSPMDKCIISLDLYKAYRKEWEDFLVRETHSNYTKNRLPLEGTETSLPRFSTFDPTLQLTNNNIPVTSYQDREYSWYGVTMNESSSVYESQESSVKEPILTSEALQMLDYNRYGMMPAYGRQHPYFGQGSTLNESSSNQESSCYSEYYDESSAFSDYSCAPESLSSSVHEDAPQTCPLPLQETTTSSSWFRFGSRKSRYPLQIANEPMSSLKEEPEDVTGLTEHNTSADIQDKEAQTMLDEEQNNGEEDVVRALADDEKPSTGSWFSFRRPKSPRPGKKVDDFCDERDSTPARLRREKSPKQDSRLVESNDESNEQVAGTECLNFLSSSEIVPPESEQHVQDPFPECIKLEQQGETTSKVTAETEKQSSSWFSFRRTMKPSNNTRARYEQENAKEFLSESMKQQNLETDPVEVLGEEEEDWMREVLGSRNPQANDLLAIVWPEENAIELLPPSSGVEPPQSVPKESKWLPRFLRYSKSTGTETLARIDGMESTTPNSWLDQSTVPARINHPKILNPSFFSQDDVGAHYMAASSSVIFTPRSRLETESTLPTVASEAEDESCHSPFDESGKALFFIHGVDQNLSLSEEEGQKLENYDKSPAHRSMEDVGRVLDFVKDMEENLLFLNL